MRTKRLIVTAGMLAAGFAGMATGAGASPMLASAVRGLQVEAVAAAPVETVQYYTARPGYRARPGYTKRHPYAAYPYRGGRGAPYPYVADRYDRQPNYGRPVYGRPAYGRPVYGRPAHAAPYDRRPRYAAPYYARPAYAAPYRGSPYYSNRGVVAVPNAPLLSPQRPEYIATDYDYGEPVYAPGYDPAMAQPAYPAVTVRPPAAYPPAATDDNPYYDDAYAEVYVQPAPPPAQRSAFGSLISGRFYYQPRPRYYYYDNPYYRRYVYDYNLNRGGIPNPPGPTLAPLLPPGCYMGSGDRVECN